jgi:hypothetical protein
MHSHNQKKSPRESTKINQKMMIARKKSSEIQLKLKNETWACPWRR